MVCSNRQGWIPGIVRLVARLNILHDAFVALKAISDFWVKCRGRRGHILGFMIDSLARLNISEVGKYKTFERDVSLKIRNMRRLRAFESGVLGQGIQNMLCFMPSTTWRKCVM